MSQPAELTELIADVREQVLYLRELGVEALDVKLAERPENVDLKTESVSIGSVDEVISNLRSEISKPMEPTRRPAGQSRLDSLPSLSNRESSLLKKSVDKTDLTYTEIKESATKYLSVYPPAVPFQGSGTGGTESETVSAEITLQGATPRESENTQKNENKTEMLFETAPTLPEPIETIEQIRADIGPDCTRCKLSTLGRSKVVNSVGNFNADLMFVGEAPGADEDAQGEPFVGRAGQLLTDIMKAIGFERSDVFIGNINRCRPPKNRAPEPDESIVCKPFLKREIAVVRPKVIVVLGATAAQNLLETKVPIGKLRGHFHDYLGVKVMPTFHPAYLLRDPHKKRDVWEDMKMVRDYLKVGTTK